SSPFFARRWHRLDRSFPLYWCPLALRDRDAMISRLEQLCLDKGLKMTEQRRVIARVLSDSADHPDVEQVYRRATEMDPRIRIATVYRTVRLFAEPNILAPHDL